MHGDVDINRLVIEYNKNGNQEVFSMILKQTENMIYNTIKNCKTHEKDDLYQVGAFGLLKAIKTFNIERNVKFTSYAYEIIKNEIYFYLRKNKNNYNLLSIDYIIKDIEGEEVKLIDIIPGDENVEDEIIKNEEQYKLYQLIEKFGKNKKIKLNVINLILKGEKERDISIICGISRSYVAKIKREFIKYAKNNISI